MLYELCINSGVEISNNSPVVDVDLARPSVLLQTGEWLAADIVIGADGPYSLVRERIVGRKEHHRAGPFTGYSSVPLLFSSLPYCQL